MKPSLKNCSLLFSLFFVLSVFVSCEDDLGTDPNESDDPRLALVGTWNVEEESDILGPQAYSAEIILDTDNESNIKIYNFFNLGNSLSISAEFNGDVITIKEQTVDNNIIKGQGSVSKNYTSIIFDFYADIEGDFEHVSATFTTFAISNNGEEIIALK